MLYLLYFFLKWYLYIHLIDVLFMWPICFHYVNVQWLEVNGNQTATALCNAEEIAGPIITT